MGIYLKNSSFGPTPIVTDGLLLHLDALNPKSYSGTGSTWYDMSGNNNDAYLSNDGTTVASGLSSKYSFDSSNPVHFKSDPDVQESAVDNTDGYFWFVEGTPLLNPNYSKEWTVSGWVKHKGEGVGSTNNNGTGWFTRGDQTIHVEFHGPSKIRVNTQFKGDGITSGWSVIFIDITPYMNEWMFLTTTYKTTGTYGTDSGDLKLYINDTLNTSTTAIPLLDNDARDIWLGRRNGHYRHFQEADITNYFYYNKELSLSEITQNYNAHKSRFI